MNPPIVYEVTKPRSQRATKMTDRIESIFHYLLPWSSDKHSKRTGIYETTPPNIPWPAPGGLPAGLD